MYVCVRVRVRVRAYVRVRVRVRVRVCACEGGCMGAPLRLRGPLPSVRVRHGPTGGDGSVGQVTDGQTAASGR